MSFLLYYIIGKFFVTLHFSDKEIILEKKFLFKYSAAVPISSVVKITSRRTLIMRLFRAKEITVYTLSGKIKFYLHKNETLPFLPKNRTFGEKTRFSEILFGAFIDTRALGGLFVFAAVLRKISTVLGSEYFNRVIFVLTKTAADLENALKFFRIAVPKIFVIIAVFAFGSWVFAFIRKILRLSRFRAMKNGDILFVKSGVLTLYEHALVLNSAAVIYCETITSVFTNRAPLYLRDTMISPCVKRNERQNTLKQLCGLKIPQKKIHSSKRAVFGHTAVPLFRLGAFAAALIAVHFSGYTAILLKTVLYCGIIVNLYTAVLYLLYILRSEIAFGKNITAVSARRGLRLYIAVFPNDIIKRKTVSQSVFQKRKGLCNFGVSTVERRKFTARQYAKNKISP